MHIRLSNFLGASCSKQALIYTVWHKHGKVREPSTLVSILFVWSTDCLCFYIPRTVFSSNTIKYSLRRPTFRAQGRHLHRPPTSNTGWQFKIVGKNEFSITRLPLPHWKWQSKGIEMAIEFRVNSIQTRCCYINKHEQRFQKSNKSGWIVQCGGRVWVWTLISAAYPRTRSLNPTCSLMTCVC